MHGDFSTQSTSTPTDLLEEGARARNILGGNRDLDIMARDIVSKSILGQTLFALWDSGFYEYVRQNPRFGIRSAAEALQFSPDIFACLVEYLAGWGLVRAADNRLPSNGVGHGEMNVGGYVRTDVPMADTRPMTVELTERGKAFTNAFSRGVLTLYIGGYQSILSRLGPLLRGEMSLADPVLDRSAAHAALGTENITCVSIVPAVISFLSEKGIEGVIDLGCGSGGFLLQWARLGKTRRGLGVDMSGAALAQANRQAESWGVSDRLVFREGEVGTVPLNLPPEAIAQADAVTAMYVLHEFGRDGRSKIVEVVKALRRSFPDKLFVFLEAPPVQPFEFGAIERPDRFLLDYLLVHPLSRQGLPRPPDEWADIAEEAGCRDVHHRPLFGITHMIVAKL